MGATASQGGSQTGDYEVLEGGVYAARCLAVIELGTQKNTHPQATHPTKEELMIIWELSGELMQDGRPFVVNKRYTKSLGDKAILRLDLKSWRGRDFTDAELECFALANILDKPCLLNVAKVQGKRDAKKFYNNVITVSPLVKNMTVEPRVNELIDFGIGDLGTETFNKIYPWIQNIIKESEEYKAFSAGGSGESTAPKEEAPFNPDDDIPF